MLNMEGILVLWFPCVFFCCVTGGALGNVTLEDISKQMEQKFTEIDTYLQSSVVESIAGMRSELLEAMNRQEEKLTSLEELQKTIRENMEVQNEKLASLEVLALIGTSQTIDEQTYSLQSPVFFMVDVNDVHFLLWTRSNPDNESYYKLFLNDTANLAASPFNASRPTIILAHGWRNQGHEGWPVEAKTELLTYFDCNVISIDWGKYANTIIYQNAVNSLVYVSQHSANFLDFLHNEAGLDLTSLHMTGHSLGAHLVGFIGSNVTNGPIGRITGLDPAGPDFDSEKKETSLDASDATFVDIIHTNGGPLPEAGLIDQIGDVDYYTNGGRTQPGCDIFSDIGGCSHSRSHKFWIESINGATPFNSTPCPEWDTYQPGDCSDCGQGCLDMGFHASTELRGTYYLETNANKPYAKG